MAQRLLNLFLLFIAAVIGYNMGGPAGSIAACIIFLLYAILSILMEIKAELKKEAPATIKKPSPPPIPPVSTEGATVFKAKQILLMLAVFYTAHAHTKELTPAEAAAAETEKALVLSYKSLTAAGLTMRAGEFGYESNNCRVIVSFLPDLTADKIAPETVACCHVRINQDARSWSSEHADEVAKEVLRAFPFLNYKLGRLAVTETIESAYKATWNTTEKKDVDGLWKTLGKFRFMATMSVEKQRPTAIFYWEWNNPKDPAALEFSKRIMAAATREKNPEDEKALAANLEKPNGFLKLVAASQFTDKIQREKEAAERKQPPTPIEPQPVSAERGEKPLAPPAEKEK